MGYGARVYGFGKGTRQKIDGDPLDSLTERVLGAVFEVTNTLGAGFLEKVYQRALLRELGLRGIRATAEASFTVTYKSLCRPLGLLPLAGPKWPSGR